jgi:hypothetical protein
MWREIIPSSSVTATLHYQHKRFGYDDEAFGMLIHHCRVPPPPDDARLLVVGPGEYPYPRSCASPEAPQIPPALRSPAGIPFRQPGDVVVRLNEVNSFNEKSLLNSLALALTKEKQIRRRSTLLRLSVCATTFSGAIASSPFEINLPAYNYLKYGCVIAGVIGTTATASLRHKPPKAPNTRGLESPIRLISYP